MLTRRDTVLSLSILGRSARAARLHRHYPVTGPTAARSVVPLTLQGTPWAGQNLDAWYGGFCCGINLAEGRAVSGSAAGSSVYDLTDRWSLALGYGMDNPSDGDLSLAASRTLNERYFASLFYLVTANLMLGGEYALLRTEFKEEERVTDNRIQFSGQLSF